MVLIGAGLTPNKCKIFKKLSEINWKICKSPVIYLNKEVNFQGFNSRNLRLKRSNFILEIYIEEADHLTIYRCGLLFDI